MLWDVSLNDNMAWDRMLKITEEDICATLALHMCPLEVHVAFAYEPKNK